MSDQRLTVFVCPQGLTVCYIEETRKLVLNATLMCCLKLRLHMLCVYHFVMVNVFYSSAIYVYVRFTIQPTCKAHRQAISFSMW